MVMEQLLYLYNEMALCMYLELSSRRWGSIDERHRVAPLSIGFSAVQTKNRGAVQCRPQKVSTAHIALYMLHGASHQCRRESNHNNLLMSSSLLEGDSFKRPIVTRLGRDSNGPVDPREAYGS